MTALELDMEIRGKVVTVFSLQGAFEAVRQTAFRNSRDDNVDVLVTSLYQWIALYLMICHHLHPGHVGHSKQCLSQWEKMLHIDGLVQDCSISSANALEIMQFCTKPLICNIFSH